MHLPHFYYPKYYDILLAKNKDHAIPELAIYDNFKPNQELENIGKRINQQNINTKRNYNKYMKELTAEQNKRKSGPVFDFTSNNRTMKEEAKKINESFTFSNAFRKMYEILKNTKVLDKLEKIKHFDICSMPGAFILSTNHYVKTILKKDYDWYGQSFITNKGQYFEDNYNLYHKNEGRLLIGIKGDITITDNIEYYQYFFDKNKRNFITSDCGLSGPEDEEYHRENQMMKIFLSQFVSGISVLEKNGSFLMKYYVFYGNLNVSIIYLMSLFFKEVRLIKPESSRQPRGKEIYILCIGFKDNLNRDVLNQLLKIINKLNKVKDKNKTIVRYQDINKEVLRHIENGLIKFNREFINKIIMDKEYIQNEIGYNMFKETENFLRERERLTKEGKKFTNRYIENYLKRMNYLRIKDNDKLT